LSLGICTLHTSWYYKVLALVKCIHPKPILLCLKGQIILYDR